MKEHKEKDKIKTEQIKRLKNIEIYKERINDFEKQKESLKTELTNIKEIIAKVKGRIEELQKIIDGVIIPTKEYALYSTEYVQGWITHISEVIRISDFEKKALVNECLETYQKHIKDIGLSHEHQNTVYTSIL